MRRLFTHWLVLIAAVSLSTTLAQDRRPSAPPTDVSVELLSDSSSSGLAAQRWGAIFGRLRVPVRIRRPLGSDRPDITEMQRGRTRYVRAIGKLERDGSITFPGQRFRLSDTTPLGEWIRDLKTYGAQGNPNGQKGFGLSPQQFGQIFAALEAPVPASLEGLSLDRALAGLTLPESLPLRLTSAAEQHLRASPPPPLTQAGFKGMSHGAALAILLHNAGLGYHPGRTPEGSLELAIVPLADTSGVWPVGWPLERAPLHAMPKVVEVIPVELEDVPLTDVLTAASAKTGIPILIDTHRIEAAGIQISRLKVNQPLKKMTWSGLLDRATFPDLMRELLQDESGRPFIWVTTRTVKQLNERNRQREEFEKLNK